MAFTVGAQPPWMPRDHRVEAAAGTVTAVVADLDAAEPSPPSLRGRIHLWSLAPAAATGAALVTVAATTVSGAAAAATAVYTATLLGLFAASAALHRGTWTTTRTRARLRRLDHAMIFLFIAGTTTPLAVLAVPAPRGTATLVAMWAAALAGTALSACWSRAPRWSRVTLYLLTGWAAMVILADLGRQGGAAALALVVVGGLIYSLGAVGFGLRRPRGWPATFGFHEFFHAATVTAAVCHHVAIWLVLHR